jgi:hypothetical protein
MWELIPAAIQLGSALLNKDEEQESFEFPTYNEWIAGSPLAQYKSQYEPEIFKESTYAPVSQDVIDAMLGDIQQQTQKYGKGAMYGMTNKGLLRSSIAENLFADVAKTGQQQEERLLAEIADINAQRQSQAEQNRLSRIASYLGKLEVGARQGYQTAYNQAYGNYANQQTPDNSAWQGLGSSLANVDWGSMAGSLGSFMGGGSPSGSGAMGGLQSALATDPTNLANKAATSAASKPQWWQYDYHSPKWWQYDYHSPSYGLGR